LEAVGFEIRKARRQGFFSAHSVAVVPASRVV
jgi:hypothetical protein